MEGDSHFTLRKNRMKARIKFYIDRIGIDEFKKLVDNTPANAVLATGPVIGGDGDDAPDLSKYEPSPDQLVFLGQTGVTKEEYTLQAIEDSGDRVAMPILVKLKEAVKASRG